MAEIGKRIKARRTELNMTQAELANKLGYKNKTAITKIENGINDITQTKAVEFAKVLGVSIAYLMGWKEHEDVSANTEHKKRLLVYLEKMMKLTQEHQIAVTSMIDFLAAEEEKEKGITSESSREA